MKVVANMLIVLGFVASSCTSNTETHKDKQHNIVFVMADDMGYSDLSCYGGEIKTPNIDQLANQGVRFSRYYTTPMCVTSRVSLLSGMEYMAAGGESFPNGLSFARLLREAGYATSISGKNHGMNNFRIGSPDTDYGFDHFYGFSGGQMNSFTGAGNVEWQYDGKIFPNTELPEDFYSTDYFTDYAIKFMGEAIEQGKPFFSYVAYNAPHTPLDAPERNVRKYYDPKNGVNVYKSGWENMRTERLQRMKDIGLIGPEVQLSEAGVEIPNWELLPDTSENDWLIQREFECLSRSAYAGMVDNIDENIGRVMAFLDDPNNDGHNDDSQVDNTIIIFVSDNGGCYAGLHTRRDALPWSKTNGGFTTNYGWGTLSNTPFRYYKHASHEGALRAPFIVHWPKGLKLETGSINHQMIRIWDFYPTFIELAGVSYPNHKKDLKPLMGKSILPLLYDKKFEPDGYFVTTYPRSNGLIKDGWKLVNYYDGPFELYDLSNDPTERKDLASDYPELYKEYTALWESYTEEQGFADNKEWNRPRGNKKRGWGYDFLDGGIVATTPECMSGDVPVDAKLRLTLKGKIDFSDTQGKVIRLQKYGSPDIIWSADPDESSPYQGKSTVVFNDFPTLEPNTHYYITWDRAWVRYENNNHVNPINSCKESAYAFRFRTKK